MEEGGWRWEEVRGGGKRREGGGEEVGRGGRRWGSWREVGEVRRCGEDSPESLVGSP